MKNGTRISRIRLGLFFIAAFVALPAWGQPMLSSENGGGNIHITADRLIARSQSNYAEFIGNVHAVNDDMDITADILKVFYDQSPEGDTASGAGNDITAGKTVREIVATGNVTIKFSDKTAVTDNAVYTRKTGKIVMTGADSKVTSESGYIAGEIITLQTVTEQVTVESGDSKRVEAVINSTPSDSKRTGDITPDQDS